jgi:hypothetical protein
MSAAQARDIKVIEHSLQMKFGIRVADRSKGKGKMFLNEKRLRYINEYVGRLVN